mgnify:CR=1 FL=1
MEKDQPFDQQLENRIASLEQCRINQSVIFREELQAFKESFTPGGIFASVMKELKENPASKKKLLFAVLTAGAAGLLYKVMGKKVVASTQTLVPLFLALLKIQNSSNGKH